MTRDDLHRVLPAGGLVARLEARQRFAAIALLTAALTGTGGAALGASGGHVFGAVAYFAIVVVALFQPTAITAQVLAGQLLAGSILLRQDAPAPLLLLPLVASVVATAELLAVVGRLDTPLDRDAGDDLNRAGLAAVIGGGVFGVVVLLGELPGPTGHVAIALASAACIVLATVLVRHASAA